MSLVAGVFSRVADVPPDPAICEAFRRALSRVPELRPYEFRDGRACLFALNVGAYPPGVHSSPSGTQAMVAGEPLLDPTTRPGDRLHDLARLQDAMDEDDLTSLRRTRGLYTLVYYDPRRCLLRLVADRMGIRPLYYWTDGRTVAFSSALRLLESVPGIALTPDLRAITEIAAIGYALGNRAPYEQVKLLEAGEVRDYGPAGVSATHYWTWSSMPISSRSISEEMDALHAAFSSAVRLRLGSDTTTAALLSGGLDSRCIVAGLVAAGTRVFTFNMSLPGTQDQVFGAAFAAAIGTAHREQVLGIDHPDILTIARDAWNDVIAEHALEPERPRLIWTGDDGSVSLGHLWVTKRLIELLRTGRTREAIASYLQSRGLQISARILRPDLAKALVDVPAEGLLEDLSRFASEDPVRSMHLFFSTTKLRQSLRKHVELVDLLRLELQMPFMDADVLTTVAALPVDWCIGHHFYNRWIRGFAAPVWSVPWQANVGAEPCPLPIPDGLVYQWSPANSARKRWLRFKKQLLLRDVSEMFRARRFPSDLMDVSSVRLASWAHRLGVRDCGGPLQNALVFARYGNPIGETGETQWDRTAC